MKIVQINTTYGGSTGNIMRNLHQQFKTEGHDSYIFWGRHHESISDHEQRIAKDISVIFHGALTRITDRTGFYSFTDTKCLLAKLDQIAPDVVHLHNIHGYYINVELLFRWLNDSKCKVVWTLHDCWAFTGHCVYFTTVKCTKWKTKCFDCPQKHDYPISYIFDNSEQNYLDKKELFTLLDSNRLEIIVPSGWLKNLVQQSFLNKYRITVINNPLNTDVFRPMESELRSLHNLEDKTIVLGVASPWTERKGLSTFIALANTVGNDVAIVLIGLSNKQKKNLPNNVIGLSRTSNQIELAQWYSTADVLLHPGVEETYGMTVAEAQACGTPVIVVKGSACAEAAKHGVAVEVESPDVNEILTALQTIKQLKSKE